MLIPLLSHPLSVWAHTYLSTRGSLALACCFHLVLAQLSSAGPVEPVPCGTPALSSSA